MSWGMCGHSSRAATRAASTTANSTVPMPETARILLLLRLRSGRNALQTQERAARLACNSAALFVLQLADRAWEAPAVLPIPTVFQRPAHRPVPTAMVLPLLAIAEWKVETMSFGLSSRIQS
jgi:hypothetical protein